MRKAWAIGWLAIVFAALARPAGGQVSFEEAQKRLHEKLATRPSATQPVSELDRLREENHRLRVHNSELEQEVQALRDALVHVPAETPATTRPTTGPAGSQPTTPPAPAIAGHWRGGEALRGTAFTLDFNPDGSYRRAFLALTQQEVGQYRLLDDHTVEMWTSNTPDGRQHNQYKLALTNNQLTLTPALIDGAPARNPRPLTLTRAE